MKKIRLTFYTTEISQEEIDEIMKENDCSEESAWEIAYGHKCYELGDERMNFKEADFNGVIIAFASVGTWRGRFNGYKIYVDNNGSALTADSILSSNSLDCDEVEWYSDGYNIRSRQSHHDGTNYVLYRLAKDVETAKRIAEKIYNNEMEEADFRKATRSLLPAIADVYGFKVAWRKK